MRAFTVCVVALLLLAGCAASPHEHPSPAEPAVATRAPLDPASPTPAPDAPPAPARPTVGRLAFAGPIVIDAHHAAEEPSLAIDQDGRMFVSAIHGGTPTPSHLWISTDEAATWRLADPNPAVAGSSAGGGDTSIAIAPDGSVYVADLWGGNVAISSSHDHGATWTTVPVSATVPWYDRPWLATDDQGRVLMVARTYAPGATTLAARSDDGGLVWRTVGVVSESEPAVASALGAIYGDLAFDRVSRTFAIPYECAFDAADPNAHGRSICIASTTDAGQTWSSRVAIARGTSVSSVFIALAVDQAGTWSLAWSDRSAGDLDVWVATSVDLRAWTTPVMANAGSGTHVLPAIAAGAAGELLVAWYETDARGDPNDPSAMSNASWRVAAARLQNGTWERAVVPGDPVHQGTLATGGVVLDPNAPPADRTLGDLLSVAFDARGTPWIAFASGSAPKAPIGHVARGRS